MTRRDKLVARFLAVPAEVDFDDVCRLLDMFDYVLREGGSGSHRVFVGPNGVQISVPVVSGRKVKRYYIKRIVEILDLQSYGED